MNFDSLLLPLILFSSFGTGLIIFFLKESSHRLRTSLNIFGALLKMLLVAQLLYGVYKLKSFESSLVLMPGIELTLRADTMSVLFVTLSTVLWMLTTLYAIGYLENSPH
ncbi:MAG: monovalent cation/H+ antiporter subunit D family protein, partial [Verrucomicrobiota bacterium]